MIMEQKKKKLYPLKFNPVVEETAWGTETTGIADIGKTDSEVTGGWLAESTLSEVLETYLEELVGENCYSFYGRQFPLMVKWLRIDGKMPLTVCPTDETASQRYDTLGKMKLWYVADAEPGSKVYMGFKREVSAAELYDRCHNGTLEEVLNVVTPHKGDVFLVTPCLSHAAQGGVSILEITESSDLDFRIYGFSELTQVEELALEATLDFIDLGKYDGDLYIPAGKHSAKAFDANVRSVANPDAAAGKITDRVAALREFSVTSIDLKDPVHIDTGTTDAFTVYVCLGGAASVQIQDEKNGAARYDFKAGELVLVPADVTDFYLVPDDRDTRLFEVTIEPYDEEDKYIDPEAEEKLPDDDEAEKVASIEEFLRKNPGRLN